MRDEQQQPPTEAEGGAIHEKPRREGGLRQGVRCSDGDDGRQQDLMRKKQESTATRVEESRGGDG